MKAIIIEDKDVHALVDKLRLRKAELVARYKQQSNEHAYFAEEPIARFGTTSASGCRTRVRR